MCNGQLNAVEPTHSVIVATLIVPTTGTGRVKVPTPTPTTLSTSVRSSTSNGIFIPPIPTVTSRTSLVTTTPPTTSTTLTNAATSFPVQSTPQPQNKLSTAQVAGISIGVAAAFGLAIGAILLARRRRRKYYPDLKTGFFPMRDTWAPNYNQRYPPSPPFNAFNISGPVPGGPPAGKTYLGPPPSSSFSQPVGRPDTIGLAISPPRNEAAAVAPTLQRQPSRLLPAKPTLTQPVKPTLTLTIPTSPSPRTQQALLSQHPQQPQQPPPLKLQDNDRGPSITQFQADQVQQMTLAPPERRNARESTLTEFEEDGGFSVITPGGAIWRPPSMGPLSATTYYVADKYGNWVLGDPRRMSQIAELEATTPMTALTPSVQKRSDEAFAAAAAAVKATAQSANVVPAKPAPAALGPPAEIYSARELNSADALSRASSVYSQASAPRTQNYPVPPLPSTIPIVLPPAADKPKPLNILDRQPSNGRTRKRSDSQDSATTIASSVGGAIEEERLDIAPYYSLSPVVESPSPGGGRSPVSYPKIPGRLNKSSLKVAPPPKRTIMHSPPGQPSPTLGVVQPVQASQRGDYLSSYEVPRKPAVRPNQFAPEDQRRRLDPSRILTGSPSMRLVTPSPPPPSYAAQQTSQPLQQLGSMTYQQSPKQVPQTGYAGSPSSQGKQTPTTVAAKRLGNEKAAALTLQSYEPARAKWNRAVERQSQLLSPAGPLQRFQMTEASELPETPTWKPMLTPQRRGDDLYLNVQ
jgi:hypothetical protein